MLACASMTSVWRERAMLADKDRIFTNLYGFQPWTLAAARKSGD